MGQAMATMFWRLLGREAGKPLLLSCDDEIEREEEEEISFFGRVCQFCRAIIRRLLGGGRGSRKPPSIPVSSYPVSSYHLSAHHCIVDIEIDEPVLGTAIRAVDVEIGKGPRRPRPPIKAVDVEIGKGPGRPRPPIRTVDVEIGKGPGRPRPPIRAVDVEIEKGPGRPRTSISSSVGKKLGPYSWDQKILLVGDGDFSFSASLAVAFGDASNITATSLDSFEFLMKNYGKAVANILELTSRNCKVMHGVDATKMARHPQLRSLKFDCIVYNFPHAGFANRNASRRAQISKHQALVGGFLGNAKKMIKDDGLIHITHKCAGFFLEWNLEMLGSSQGLRLVGESPFNFRHYPGYNTKFGYGGDANFNCQPSKMYKFQLANTPALKKGSSRNNQTNYKYIY